MKILDKFIRFAISLSDSKDKAKLRAYYKKKFNVQIGKYSYGFNIYNIGSGSSIGAFCSIAPGVIIGLMNHPYQWVSTNPFLYYSSRGFIPENKTIDTKIGSIIGDDVWIGANAVILPGVIVGQGAIIGAGAVVTKEVMPYEIVGGVPASHLKWRFEDPSMREKLSHIRWGSLSDEVLKDSIELFYNPMDFVNEFGKDDKS